MIVATGSLHLDGTRSRASPEPSRRVQRRALPAMACVGVRGRVGQDRLCGCDSTELAEVRPTILRPRCKHALYAGPALERIASRHAPDPSALFPLPSSLTPWPRVQVRQ